mmetsp:Transcript_9024/g.11645  ORF Transcript_9024/g.11645 Transcript_9024/m.11645 type:complete len:215 (-) Transcript_9024:832-1476(-)
MAIFVKLTLRIAIEQDMIRVTANDNITACVRINFFNDDVESLESIKTPSNSDRRSKVDEGKSRSKSFPSSAKTLFFLRFLIAAFFLIPFNVLLEAFVLFKESSISVSSKSNGSSSSSQSTTFEINTSSSDKSVSVINSSSSSETYVSIIKSSSSQSFDSFPSIFFVSDLVLRARSSVMRIFSASNRTLLSFSADNCSLRFSISFLVAAASSISL